MVGGQAPDRINAEGVGSQEDSRDIGVQVKHGVLGQVCITPARLVGHGSHAPPGGEDGGGAAEALVVNEAGVHGEQAHEQEQIAAPEEGLPDLILHGLHGRLVLSKHHGQGKEEHEQPVAHVAKHYREEEGEGDDGVGCRVDLLVAAHTVGIHNALEAGSEAVGADERRGHVLAGDAVSHSTHSYLTRAGLQHLLQGGQVTHGTPDLRNEALVCGAHAALVEGQVHSLHLPDLQLPSRQQLLHPAQHLAQEALGLPQDLLQLLALLLQLLQGSLSSPLLLQEREDVAMEACCDLSDLLSNLLAPVGDEEGHPPCRLARHGVLQLLFHLLEAGNEEASTGPPEQALQGSGLVGLHGTCHKDDLQVLMWASGGGSRGLLSEEGPSVWAAASGGPWLWPSTASWSWSWYSWARSSCWLPRTSRSSSAKRSVSSWMRSRSRGGGAGSLPSGGGSARPARRTSSCRKVNVFSSSSQRRTSTTKRLWKALTDAFRSLNSTRPSSPSWLTQV